MVISFYPGSPKRHKAFFLSIFRRFLKMMDRTDEASDLPTSDGTSQK